MGLWRFLQAELVAHPLLSQQAILLTCWEGNPPAAPPRLGQVGAETHHRHRGAALLLLLAEGSGEKKDVCYEMDRLGQNPGKTCMCLHVNGKLLSGQQSFTQSPAKTTLPWAGGTEGLCGETGVIHLNVIPSSSTWDLNVSLGSPWPQLQQERLCG